MLETVNCCGSLVMKKEKVIKESAVGCEIEAVPCGVDNESEDLSVG